MNRYASYEKFFNPDQAQAVLSILKENNIPHEFTSIKQAVDQVITGGGPAYSYEVRIPADQFTTANRILRENIQVDLDEVDADYYLFGFNDFELTEILRQPDEWGRLDFVVARKILETRGIVYTNEELDALWNNRMETLARPARGGNGWIYFGHGASVIAPFFGIIVGLVFWKTTKTLPNGNRYFMYDDFTRKRGKSIFYLSLIVTVVVLTFFLAKSYLIVTENWFEW